MRLHFFLKIFSIVIILIIVSGIGLFLFLSQRNYEYFDKTKAGKRKVELRKEAEGFRLYKDGQPYYIQGAGGNGQLDFIKKTGGNSIRTWSTQNAREILDKAQALGLTVTLGLDIGRPRLGFDYGDEKAKKEQLKWVRNEVMKYKDHPALLMWAVGNEVSEEWEDNAELWKGVNEIANLIHKVDTDHPVTTMIAPKTSTILFIKYLCPDINILSINTFGFLPHLSSKLRRTLLKWDGAYIVSEWGPKGHWETDSTQWSAPIEQTTTEKAEICKENYKYIQQDKEKCLGSYLFYWGHKQERTSTWFSLFSEKGEKTETVDVMNYLWKGTWPSNRCPSISPIIIDSKPGKDNIVLLSNSLGHTAKITAKDPESDSLSFYWQLLKESVDLKKGGDGEASPDEVSDISKLNKGREFDFQSPKEEGAYRLYVYVADGNKNIANANIPFYVVFP